MQRNIDVTFLFMSYSFFQSLQDHKAHKDRRGCIASVSSLREMRRVSNASDLESTPARAALASNLPLGVA